MTNIKCNYFAGTSSKQNISEATGGCSDIQCQFSYHVDFRKFIQGGGKFMACSRSIINRLENEYLLFGLNWLR